MRVCVFIFKYCESTVVLLFADKIIPFFSSNNFFSQRLSSLKILVSPSPPFQKLLHKRYLTFYYPLPRCKAHPTPIIQVLLFYFFLKLHCLCVEKYLIFNFFPTINCFFLLSRHSKHIFIINKQEAQVVFCFF